MIDGISGCLILGTMLVGVFVLCHALNALAESIYWWWQDRKYDDEDV